MNELSKKSGPDLKRLTSSELEEAWRQHFGEKVPDQIPASLMARLLAYRLQVEQYGGLSKRARAYLKVIETDIGDGRAPETPYPDERKLKLGCQIIRKHEGVEHRLTVVNNGYQWNGKTFTSLSAAAKAITGTNWNGYRFFGLKLKSRTRGEAAP